MFSRRFAGVKLSTRSFSNAGYRKPVSNNKIKAYNSKRDLPAEWDHVYGLSSVLSALHSQKRSVLDMVYIQESDEKKTTHKKDATLLTEILQLAKELNIRAVATDKGKLNNLTDNKTHQVTKLNSFSKIRFIKLKILV